MQTKPTDMSEFQYTVFSFYHANFIHGIEDRHGEIVELEYMYHPNKPRLSVDGLNGIVTGIFDIQGAAYLTQKEAEDLMQEPEWTHPEEELI